MILLSELAIVQAHQIPSPIPILRVIFLIRFLTVNTKYLTKTVLEQFVVVVFLIIVHSVATHKIKRATIADSPTMKRKIKSSITMHS